MKMLASPHNTETMCSTFRTDSKVNAPPVERIKIGTPSPSTKVSQQPSLHALEAKICNDPMAGVRFSYYIFITAIVLTEAQIPTIIGRILQ